MTEHDAIEEPEYQVPTLEALGTVEEYTEGTDISIVVQIGG